MSITPSAPVCEYVVSRSIASSKGHSPKAAERATMKVDGSVRAATAGLVGATVFIFCRPYGILAFPEFLEWNLRELDIVKNAGIVPYTVQYVGTPKFLYELQQTTFWGLGLPLGIMAWGGLVLFIVGYAMFFIRPRKFEKRWRGQPIDDSGEKFWDRLRRRGK